MMTLSKQQKLAMIYDVELRLAKEELAEHYMKSIKAIENSDKPLRTVKHIIENKAQLETMAQEKEEQTLSRYQNDIDAVERLDEPVVSAERNQGYNPTKEDQTLLDQSEMATKTPAKKSGMDSRTEWEFNALEILAMRDAARDNFDLQSDFENAQDMSLQNYDLELER